MSVTKEQLCDMINIIRDTDDAINTNIYGKYDVSFRVGDEDVKLDSVMSLDELVFLYDDIEINILSGKQKNITRQAKRIILHRVHLC